MEVHSENPQPQPQPQSGGNSDKKMIAGILGILLGGLGVHKFYLGYTQTGIIQLIIGVLTCGIGGIIGLIEGIIYLTKTDEEFEETYVINQKQWF